MSLTEFGPSLFVRRVIYHRGAIDATLVEDVLQLLESAFSRLGSHTVWALGLYLLHAPADRQIFNLWEAKRDLTTQLDAKFWADAWATFGATSKSDLRRAALQTWGYSLGLSESEDALRCRLKGAGGNRPHDLYYADAGLHFSEAVGDGLTAPGRLTALARALPVVSNHASLYGAIALTGNVTIAPHLELSQRHARGRQRQVYLPSPSMRLLVGPYPGCDLVAPSLPAPRWVDFVAGRGAVAGPGPDRGGADYDVEYVAPDDRTLPAGINFENLLRSRAQTRDYFLEVLGRVVPRAADAQPRAPGAGWAELNHRLECPVRNLLRLTASSAIVVDEGENLLIWSGRQEKLERVQQPGQLIEVDGQRYRWEPEHGGPFYGSLLFEEGAAGEGGGGRRASLPAEQPLSGVIARGPSFALGLPAILPDYQDDEMLSHRGSLLIDSDGNGHFKIAVAETTAQRELYVRSGERGWVRVPPVGDPAPLTLSSPFELAFGSSRYLVASDGEAYRLRNHWSGAYQVLDLTDGAPHGRGITTRRG